MPAPTAALATYAQSSVATASPHEIVRMAYERVITACDRAEQAERDRGPHWLQTFHDETVRAQAVLWELSAGLAVNHPNPDVVALSRHLDDLYRFAIKELVKSNTHKTPGPVTAVRMVVDGLLDAWVNAPR